MKAMNQAWCLAACWLVAGCAATSSSTALTEPRIYDACMKVEVPKTVERDRAEGKSAEDSALVAHFICKVTSGICAKDPGNKGCPESLKAYGLLP